MQHHTTPHPVATYRSRLLPTPPALPAPATFVVLATLAAFAALGLPACSSMYYRTMEAFGYAKRDLLVENVEKARESQTTAKTQFQLTFDAFKKLTDFEGGELEKRYRAVAAEYDRAKASASTVSARIAETDEVATAMFSEWGQEIEEFESPELRQRSEELKAETERRYGELISAMRAAEERMAPVLAAFNDHVLSLKHALNAQAIASLRSDVLEIESDVERLLREMQNSIDQADAFLASIEKNPT